MKGGNTYLQVAGELKKTIKLSDGKGKSLSVLSKGLYSGPLQDGLPSGDNGVCK